MKDFKITVIGKSGLIRFDVFKTLIDAQVFAKKLANVAFHGEEVEIFVESRG